MSNTKNGYLYIRPTRNPGKFRVITRAANHEALEHSQELDGLQTVKKHLMAMHRVFLGEARYLPCLLEAGLFKELGRHWAKFDMLEQVFTGYNDAPGLTEAPITLETEAPADTRLADLFAGLAVWLTSVETIPVMLERDEEGQLWYKLINHYLQANGAAGIDVNKDFPSGISFPSQPGENGIL